MTHRVPVVSAMPASSFGIVVGLSGLGSAWRAAHTVWQPPSAIGETLLLPAGVVWALLLIASALEWIVAPHVFVAVTLAIGVVVVGTLWLALRGRLFSMPAPIVR